jgi:broad specificity phosphatase PhoE
MTNTVLGLIRHGQTDWNIDLRLQGTTDIPMNEVGIEQVVQAAEHLDEDWDVLLSSPLGRAKHTAELLRGRLKHLEVVEEQLLLERAFGVGEGFTYAQWQEKFANLDEIPGAEPRANVEERARRLLEHVKTEYAGARVLAVSHGALIRFVLSEVTDGMVPPAGERLQNASLHILRHGQSWSLDAWAPLPLGQGFSKPQ